jgi:hypothetical protein
MGPDRLQMQRLEYLISERQALLVREFVRSHLELDEYGVNQPDCSYTIHSLYLDSDDLRTYWDTINGNKNRFKLRLRYYSAAPDAPVFFEIKRRVNDAILKQRGGVHRHAVPLLLAGHLPGPEHLLNNQPKQLVALQRFCQLMLDLRASPKAHVCYRREAWISTHDNSARVTMDREVLVAPEFTARLGLELDGPVRPFGHQVILELKFTGRFPRWFQDLVETFGLFRASAAKYVDGLTELGIEKFQRGVHTLAFGGPKGAPARAVARRRAADLELAD